MVGRTFYPALLVFLVASSSLASPPAYEEGSVIVEVRGAILTYGSADLVDIYGPEYYEPSGFGGGVGAGVGLGYALTPAIHLVGAWEPLVIHRRWIVWEGGAEDRWALDASAILAGVRWFLLTSEAGNIYIGVSGGRYALSGAHVDYTYATGHLDFSGSTLGGFAELGGQWMLAGRLSVMGGLGYRSARIFPVRFSGTVDADTYAPQDYRNEDGSRAAIDLSGLTIFAALAFSLGTL